MFELTGIRHGYQGREVLRLDSWRADDGEHWLLLGPSGSGKTTLLHMLACILRADEGTVRIAGTDVSTLNTSECGSFRGRHIGIVLQRLHLIGSLTVLQNLLLAQYLAGLPQDERRAHEVLEHVGMADRMTSRPHELSFGQAQRVAIARAVINRPRLLLADEPTSNLDDDRCSIAFDLIASEALACGATLVIATHDQRIRNRVEKTLILEAQS